jgi:hypothetical protein
MNETGAVACRHVGHDGQSAVSLLYVWLRTLPWRLRRVKEALAIFNRMLWLNPDDNQGARFPRHSGRAKLGTQAVRLISILRSLVINHRPLVHERRF